MTVDRPIADRHTIGIRVVHQLLTGLDDAGPASETLKKQELGHRQRDDPSQTTVSLAVHHQRPQMTVILLGTLEVRERTRGAAAP